MEMREPRCFTSKCGVPRLTKDCKHIVREHRYKPGILEVFAPFLSLESVVKGYRVQDSHADGHFVRLHVTCRTTSSPLTCPKRCNRITIRSSSGLRRRTGGTSVDGELSAH